MNDKLIVAGLVGGGILAFILLGRRAQGGTDDWQIDPDIGKHRGLAVQPGGRDSSPVRMPSAQDPKGGGADYIGYTYGGTTPSVYAKGEPAQTGGAMYDRAVDRWNFVPPSPLDYQRPPLRIPKLWKDATRYWDGLSSYGGTEVVAQRLHLFHLRPSSPTRGYRSISGSLAPIGGGQSTSSRLRIPAIFIPSITS